MQSTCSFDGAWQGDRDHAPFRPYYLLAAFWHKAVNSGIVPIANVSAGAFAWVVEPVEFGAKAKMLCGLNASSLQVSSSGQTGEGELLFGTSGGREPPSDWTRAAGGERGGWRGRALTIWRQG